MRTQIKTISVFLIGIAIASCSSNPEKKNETAKAEVLPLVKAEEAKIEKFVHEIRVQGTVETEKNTVIGAELGGTITEIRVKEGDKVKAGQVLVVIDASVLNASAEEIRTQLEYAQYMLNKQEELKSRGVGTEFDLETAKNQVNALNSKLNSLSVQQSKSTIKAPFDGVIDRVFASKGQIAGPQSPLIRLVNNKEVDVVTSVSERYISNVREGGTIQVSFPNYDDTVLALTISSVGNYIEPTNRTFRIRANVKNNDWLLPNMMAIVKVADQVEENGLVIPSASILKNGQNEDYVYVINKKDKSNIAEMRSVKVLARYESKALIEKGENIKPGDLIVTDGARGIENNDKVQIKK